MIHGPRVSLSPVSATPPEPEGAALPPLLTTRHAIDLLRRSGIGPRQAHRLLRSGMVGEPTRVRGALLYDTHVLERLLDRPLVTDRALARWMPEGLLILRRALLADWDDRRCRDELEPGWDMGVAGYLALQLRLARHPRVAVVTTIGGIVVHESVLVGVRWRRPGVVRPIPRDRPDPPLPYVLVKGPIVVDLLLAPTDEDDDWAPVLHRRRLRDRGGRAWSRRLLCAGDLFFSGDEPQGPRRRRR